MQRLKYIFPIWVFLNFAHVYGQTTKFFWELNPKNPTQGECFEIDSQTNGRKYKAKVSKTRCRPNEIAYLFVPLKSACFEVDPETNGKKFIKRVTLEKCKPEKTIFNITQFNGEVGCYEIDSKTMGEYYFKKVESKFCESKLQESTGKVTLYWEYIERGKGNCYQEVNNGQETLKVKVKDEDCRSNEVQYIFMRTTETKGICIEEDIKNPKAYSLKINEIEKCKPKNTIYVFYKDAKQKAGHCFEIDVETKGNQYINIVEDKLCIPAN